MSAGRPKIDFALAISNCAHMLIRRTNGQFSHWMKDWVVPQKEAWGEDALLCFKDFLADVTAAGKSVDAQPGGANWDSTSEDMVFQNISDENVFKEVKTAFAAKFVVTGGKAPKGKGGGRGRGSQDRGHRNVGDTKPGGEVCDSKSCPGLAKHGAANPIYAEMLRKNPGVLLCVTCYVTMLRDEVDVPTFNHGTIRYRKPLRNEREMKAKMAQVVEGQGAKVLNYYHLHAESLPYNSPRRSTIKLALANLPDSYYLPDSARSSDVNQSDIVARLAKLELVKSEAVSVQTKGGGSVKVGEAYVGSEELQRQRSAVLEEWFAHEQKNSEPSGAGESGDLSSKLSLFKAMTAAKQI
jgi:hypothetical protein